MERLEPQGRHLEEHPEVVLEEHPEAVPVPPDHPEAVLAEVLEERLAEVPPVDLQQQDGVGRE